MSLTCSENNETKYSQIPFIKEARYNKNVVSINKNKRNWSVFKLKVLAYVFLLKMLLNQNRIQMALCLFDYNF